MRLIGASLAAVVATAILLVLSLPPVGWGPLAWFALVPTFLVSYRRGFLIGFLIGISASLVLGWLAVSGLLYTVKSFTGDRTWTYLGTAMFGFVLSLCCGFVGEMKSVTWRGALGIGAFAVLMDFLLMPVLPVTFAITQSRVPGLLALSSYTGIWGVSFALWAVNLGLALGVLNRSWKALAGMAATVLALLVFAVAAPPAATAQTMSVAVVQSPSDDLSKMERLSRKSDPHLAVWPEFAGIAHVRSGDPAILVELASREGMPMIVTSFPDDFSPKPHNTASLFSHLGESSRYYKRRLFGGEKNMHTPGVDPVAAKTDWGPVGLNICFDSCFPNLMRESSLQGPVGLIALPTIDPESPHGFIAAMHAAFTPFRAAELGVAIARADGYAHSMIVENNGQIVAELGPGVEDSIRATVDTTPKWTLYKAVGDWFLIVCAGILIMVIGLSGRDKALQRRSAERLKESSLVQVLQEEHPKVAEVIADQRDGLNV